MHMYQRVLFATILVITVEINGMPAPGKADHQTTNLESHDNVLTGQQAALVNSLSRDEELRAFREKRHVVSTDETPEFLINKTQSNETSFEEYEKEYLINLTKNLLEQFLHYDQYVNHLKEENSSNHDGSTSSPGQPTPLPHNGQQTTPDTRIDSRLLQQKLSELQGMNVNQLEKIFNNLHRAAKDGAEDPGITSLCCNMG